MNFEYVFLMAVIVFILYILIKHTTKNKSKSEVQQLARVDCPICGKTRYVTNGNRMECQCVIKKILEVNKRIEVTLKHPTIHNCSKCNKDLFITYKKQYDYVVCSYCNTFQTVKYCTCCSVSKTIEISPNDTSRTFLCEKCVVDMQQNKIEMKQHSIVEQYRYEHGKMNDYELAEYAAKLAKQITEPPKY